MEGKQTYGRASVTKLIIEISQKDKRNDTNRVFSVFAESGGEPRFDGLAFAFVGGVCGGECEMMYAGRCFVVVQVVFRSA